jgi:signal transduction histidine kinase
MANDEKKSISPLTAAAFGAAIGATAVYLSNRENREKVAGQIGDMKKGAERTMHDLRGEVKKLRHGTDKALREAEEAKDDIAKEMKKE